MTEGSASERHAIGLSAPLRRALSRVGRGRGWGLLRFNSDGLWLERHPPPRLAQGRSPTLPTARKGSREEGDRPHSIDRTSGLSRRLICLAAAPVFLLLTASRVLSAEIPLSERKSGYEFMGRETRAMQD